MRASCRRSRERRSLVMTKRLRRFEPRLNTVGDMMSIVLPPSVAGVVSPLERMETIEDGAVSPPYSAPSSRSAEDGGLAPAYS